MRNNVIILAIFFLACQNLFAQSPSWSWAKRGGDANNEGSQSVTTDAFNNVYVTGYFSNTITFGAFTLTSAGLSDIFIVKYDPLGNVIWAKREGSIGYDYGFNIATDAAGDVYITGFYCATITFGSTTYTNAGSDDIFLLKYDSSGNVIWSKTFGNIEFDFVSGLCTDLSNNVYITGLYESLFINFGTSTLFNQGGQDLYIAKFDALGNFLWAKNAGSISLDYGKSIVTDAAGNVYVTGNYGAPITFGTTTLSNSGNYDIFIAKYDPLGNLIWVKGAGNTGEDVGNGISIDDSDNIYITGKFSSSSLSFGNYTLNNAGGFDMFIVKYDELGNVLWAKSEGGVGDDFGNGITIDSLSNPIVTGYFQSDTMSLGTETLINQGIKNIFIVKYDSMSNIVWSKGAGGIGEDEAWSIHAHGNGEIYLAGYFSSAALNFGPTSLSTAGSYDMFVAKLDDVSLNYFEKNKKMNNLIQPNPFNYSSTIQLNDNINNGHLFIYSANGNLACEIKNINGNKVHLTRNSLSNGLYFVMLTEGNKVILSEKIVIAD